jgi:two-component system, OmpR family, phosphate regulon response regulator PhoB
MTNRLKCVLVVDDDDLIRDMVGKILKVSGYRVELTDDGEHDLAKVITARTDAIVLDLMMPGMGGLGFLRHCSANPDCSATPVVLMSAA